VKLPASSYETISKRLPKNLGYSSYSLDIPVVTRYATVVAPTFVIRDRLTIMAWVRPIDTGAIMDVLSRSTAPQLFAIRDAGNRSYFYLPGTTVAGWNFAYPNDLFDGYWHHLAGTYDKDAGANNLRYYIDGNLVAFTTATGQITLDADPLYIGYRLAALTPYRGLVDEIGMYSEALSLSQIRHNILNYNDVIGDGLVLWLRFEEGSGLTAFDSSPEGNDADLLPALTPPVFRRNEKWELRSEVDW